MFQRQRNLGVSKMNKSKAKRWNMMIIKTQKMCYKKFWSIKIIKHIMISPISKGAISQ